MKRGTTKLRFLLLIAVILGIFYAVSESETVKNSLVNPESLRSFVLGFGILAPLGIILLAGFSNNHLYRSISAHHGFSGVHIRSLMGFSLQCDRGFHRLYDHIYLVEIMAPRSPVFFLSTTTSLISLCSSSRRNCWLCFW